MTNQEVATTTAQDFIWCLIANVTREPHPEGEDGELRIGTRHFAPGAKLYCFPFMWGDGGERIRVLGQHRKGARLVEMVVACKRLTNFRAKQVFHPHVIRAMRGLWEASEKSEAEAREMAEALGKRAGQQ